jgi:hypothetical protein
VSSFNLERKPPRIEYLRVEEVLSGEENKLPVSKWTVNSRVPHTVLTSSVKRYLPEWYNALFDLVKDGTSVRYDWATVRQKILPGSWAQNALTALVTAVGPTEEVVLAAIVKVLMVSKGVVRLRGSVQTRVETVLLPHLPLYLAETSIVTHLTAASPLGVPETLDALTLSETARSILLDISTSVLCCNIKFVFQVLFGMLRRPQDKRGRKPRKRKAAGLPAPRVNAAPKRGRGRPRKRQAEESDDSKEEEEYLTEVESEVESESEDTEGNEGSDEEMGGDKEAMALLDSFLYVVRQDFLVSASFPLLCAI